MKIAITGGSGLLGRAVIESGLRQGFSFVNIDRVPPPRGSTAETVPFIQAEVTQYDPLLRAFSGCEALIHLAAIPKPFMHPDHEVHNNNVVGSYNALRAAVEVGMTRICQASSVNAIGHEYSRKSRYDYFPVDELHPTYNEDAYSLSKWICEQQADSFVRRYENLTIASLRFHWITTDRSVPAQNYAEDPQRAAILLTAYTHIESAARACLLSLTAPIRGHEVFFIIAPDTAVETPSLDLARTHYPTVPIRGDLSGNRSFFDSSKAERLLGWSHRS